MLRFINDLQDLKMIWYQHNILTMATIDFQQCSVIRYVALVAIIGTTTLVPNQLLMPL